MTQSALALLTRALREALASDPANKNYLAALGSVFVQVDIVSPSFQLHIHIDDGEVTLHKAIPTNSDVNLDAATPDSTAPQPDINVHGKSTDLVKLLLSPAQDAAALRGANIRIDGDVALLLDLTQTLDKIEIDWVALLADTLGETPAVVLSNIAAQGKETLSTAKEKGEDWLESLLSKPDALVISKEQNDALKSQLRELNYRLDRLDTKFGGLSPTASPLNTAK